MSVEPCSCSGPCKLIDTETPCWGKVAPVDKDADGEWIHGCEGHEPVLRGGTYRVPVDSPP